MIIEFVKFNENLPNPYYVHHDDAGFDLRSASEEPIVIKAGEMEVVPLGIAMAIPVGYELQLRPRSGLARKFRITLQNTPGTIDSGYRNEIAALVVNEGKDDFTVNFGDRICQGVIAPIIHANFVEVDALDITDRGLGGFGSTGI